jgi:hypothetical protein
LSEYQYYEFQAIDRPLGPADQQALRALSTRARITITSFINSYEWGDFKGDPARLMETWFDLHLYLANWGARRLMIRCPQRLIDQQRLGDFLGEVDWVTIRRAGDNLILDILREEVEPGEDWPDEDFDDGPGWLAALAPLRADLLGGDLRLFYLLWLTAVEDGSYEPDAPEPMAGIGPMTQPLQAFADFFGVDADLVQAAAERGADATATSQVAVRHAIAAMTDDEKTDILLRLLDGAPHVAAELRAGIRRGLDMGTGAGERPVRTVGELRSRAGALRIAREKAAAERAAAIERRRAQELEKARQARLLAIRRRGASVWREVETEIERCNAAGYERATALLLDLHAIAEEQGAPGDFAGRLRSIRERHARKERFIERLRVFG